MKSIRILRFAQFDAVNESQIHNINICEVTAENISSQAAEPLYESGNFPALCENESTIFVFPIGDNVTIEALTNCVTKVLNREKQSDKEIGFSVGNFYKGDNYKSGGHLWNEDSLCVSLFGVTVANERFALDKACFLMSQLNLPRLLVLIPKDNKVLEVVKEDSKVKTNTKNHIKRVGE